MLLESMPELGAFAVADFNPKDAHSLCLESMPRMKAPHNPSTNPTSLPSLPCLRRWPMGPGESLSNQFGPGLLNRVGEGLQMRHVAKEYAEG